MFNACFGISEAAFIHFAFVVARDDASWDNIIAKATLNQAAKVVRENAEMRASRGSHWKFRF